MEFTFDADTGPQVSGSCNPSSSPEASLQGRHGTPNTRASRLLEIPAAGVTAAEALRGGVYIGQNVISYLNTKGLRLREDGVFAVFAARRV